MCHVQGRVNPLLVRGVCCDMEARPPVQWDAQEWNPDLLGCITVGCERMKLLVYRVACSPL